MRWAGIKIGVRDGYGTLVAGLITGVLYGIAPFCALVWGWSHPYDITIMLAPNTDEYVVLVRLPAIHATEKAQTDEQGAQTDDPVAAGPNPIDSTDPEAGMGDAIADADGGGEDGATEADEDPLAAMTDNGKVVTKVVNKNGTSMRARNKPRLDTVKGYTQYAKDYVLGRQNVRPNRCKDTHEDVAQSGKWHWDVNRELIEYYTKSIARFNSLGWSGPYNEEELKGWKIGGFGCNSPLYHAGLRRGDIILTVNDKPTRTWLQVFGAYRRLKRNTEFEIVIVRRGKEKTLLYTLVEA